MRNATILVVQLRGTATEAIKNIVLAGIGKLILVDGEEVTEEDLGAGFFFRDEDVGKKVSFELYGVRNVMWTGAMFISCCLFYPESGGCEGTNRKPEPSRDSGDGSDLRCVGGTVFRIDN